jgi:multidrug efflux pump subunit AcrA (membrane-fusion protein)
MVERMTALDDYVAALREADQARKQAVADADRRHVETVSGADAALEAAQAEHDAVIAASDAARREAAEKAAQARLDAADRADQAYDDAKRAELNAPDARIERSGGGSLFLKSGRSVLGSATPVAGGHWRVNGDRGIVFVPDATAGRSRLWDQIADDEAAT